MSKRRDKDVYDLGGRRAVITGATSGIGAVVAGELAASGAAVTLLARNHGRAQVTLEHVREVARAAGHDPALHRCVMADFADLSTVARAAREIGEDGPVHMLVNNAGLISGRRVRTVDGHELTFQVNHLAHFLLTNLLMGHLEAAGDARIVTVSSDAHQAAWRGLHFGDLDFERRRYDAFAVYAHSKLANVLFGYEAARRGADSGVTSNVVHPGVVRTGFGRGWSDPFGFGWKLLSPLWLTPAEGADTVMYLAASPEVEGATGRYYYQRRQKRSSAASYDTAAALRLWEVSERLVGLT